jgi:hypothetical protein
MAADVRIDIAAQFVGKPAFRQAENATFSLTKSVKKLAGALGIAYGTQAVIAYGKASAKAFAADEAAAKRLAGAVENLGIGFANPQIATFIANLEKTAGVADDVLRPAFQGLLTTTGSLVQSQKLLNDALTISRASGIDLATVSSDLAKGYVGITKGLSKYNTGLTKAELSSKSFADILDVLLQRSAGAAQDYLTTTSYKFDVLSVASQNASEIIGGGLVDAFALLAGGTDAKDAATAIENIATAIAAVERAIGRTVGAIPTLINNLKNLPKSIFGGFAGKAAGVNMQTTQKKEEVKLTVSQKRQQELLAKLESAAVKRNKELLALKNKQLATDKLKTAIEKANAALAKGADIFDMDKIQIAAALTNQAEQLGKATTGAQILQIANDTARLKVKQDILALEDAIASQDQAAIEAATKKLNADMAILGSLQNQSIKLLDIKSILESLKPKDLINLDNLNEALRLLGLINLASTGSKTTPSGYSAGTGTVANQAPNNTGYPNYGMQVPSSIASTNLNTELLGGLVSVIGSNLKEYIAPSASGYGVGAHDINIKIETGIGDPNAIAEAVNQVIQDAVDRGTLRGGAY